MGRRSGHVGKACFGCLYEKRGRHKILEEGGTLGKGSGEFRFSLKLRMARSAEKKKKEEEVLLPRARGGRLELRGTLEERVDSCLGKAAGQMFFEAYSSICCRCPAV